MFNSSFIINDNKVELDLYQHETYKILLFTLLRNDVINDIDINKKYLCKYLSIITKELTSNCIKSYNNEHLTNIIYENNNILYSLMSKDIESFINIFTIYILNNLQLFLDKHDRWINIELNTFIENIRENDYVLRYIINKYIINDEYINKSEENNFCLLCYNNSDYITKCCNYVLCNDCLNRLREIYSDCPCCRKNIVELVRLNDQK